MAVPAHPTTNDRAEADERTIRQVLDLLSRRAVIPPGRLHQLRIGLRRTQARFDLSGDRQAALMLGRHVSSLSPLRTAQVFEAWLARHQAPVSDLRAARRLVRDRSRQLIDTEVFTTIRGTFDALSRSGPLDPSCFQRTWRTRRPALIRLCAALREKPKRKGLHALRLQLKQLRYQLEWTAPRTASATGLIARLKQAQQCLGTYEELAAFRKLAKHLDLSSRPDIVRAWRGARRKARRVPEDTAWLRNGLGRVLAASPARPSLQDGRRKINVDLTNH